VQEGRVRVTGPAGTFAPVLPEGPGLVREGEYQTKVLEVTGHLLPGYAILLKPCMT